MTITMITVTQILDKVLPYTKEERGCSFKKVVKAKARNNLVILINDYRQGKPVALPEEVKKLLVSDEAMF